MQRIHPLKAWRLGQLVPAEGGGTRPMQLIEAAARGGVPVNTWWGWERWPGDKGFRRPDDVNMAMLFELTQGAVRPEHYYALGDTGALAAAAAG